MERACKKARKHLFAYLNLQLEEQTAKEIEGHIARCPLCRKEAEGLRATWNLLGSYSIDRGFPRSHAWHPRENGQSREKIHYFSASC